MDNQQDKPERPLLNRQQRRAAEKLAQTPFWKKQAKKVEIAVLKAALERQYMEEAMEEVLGSPLD